MSKTKAFQEFYYNFCKSRHFIIQHLLGLNNEDEKLEFTNLFMIQLLIIWILQNRNFFDQDQNFLIAKFHTIQSKTSSINYKTYFNFIICFLNEIFSDKKLNNEGMLDTPYLHILKGLSPAFVLNNKYDLNKIRIPDECFYQEGITQNFSKKNKSSFQGNIPILNLFQIQDMRKGFLDESIIGLLYEKLIIQKEKREKGAYYTPDYLTNYICEKVIQFYILDRINNKFSKCFYSIGEILNSCEIRYIKFLYEELKSLRILDPAVGTGHFLESCFHYLLKIYVDIWKFVKDLGIHDENKFDIQINKNHSIHIASISSENILKSYVACLQIFPNNLYGVDISSDVVKIANARMFLLSTKYYYPFTINPLGYFSSNIKNGNTLIGFIKKTPTVEISTDRLNDLFAKTYPIYSKFWRNMYPFHWIIEFPKIFTEANGFDIIVTNPPYLGESGNKELFRKYSEIFPQYSEGKMDLWYLFIQRCLDLLAPNKGYLTFISSNYWLTAFGASKLRKRILKNTSIIEYINFGENKVFSNAQGIHTNLVTLKKIKKPNKNIQTILYENIYSSNTNLIEKKNSQIMFTTDQSMLIIDKWNTYFHFLPKMTRIIITQIIHHSYLLKNSNFYVKEGIVTGLNKINNRLINKYSLPDVWNGLGVFILQSNCPSDLETIESFSLNEFEYLKPFFKNSDIKRFYTSYQSNKSLLYVDRNYVKVESLPNIQMHLNRFHYLLNRILDNPPYLNRPRSQKIFTSPKIITSHRSKMNDFAYNSIDWYAGQDVYYILEKENNKEALKSLLLILNSKLSYFWLYWMGKRKGKYLELFVEPLNYFPVPKVFNRCLGLSVISDYLLFMQFLSKDKPKVKRLIKFFHEEIADFIIFEIYFWNEICEDESDPFELQKYVLQKLVSIDCEQVLRNENQFELVREKYFKIIESCYNSLRTDKNIEKKLDQIKNNPTIRVILEFYDSST